MPASHEPQRWSVRVGPWLLLGLLLLAASSIQAHNLETLLAFLDTHNPRLLAQRQLLATLDTEPTGGAAMLTLLEQQQRSWRKYARLESRLGARAAPGQEGTGLVASVGVQIAIPLDDASDRLALARERQSQAQQQYTHQQQHEAARLAYATLRQQLVAEVVAKLAALEELAATLAAIERQRVVRQAQQALIQQRVETGVESRAVLWQLSDQVSELERQITLHQAQSRKVRLEIALYGGDQWRTLLGWLEEHRSLMPFAGR